MSGTPTKSLPGADQLVATPPSAHAPTADLSNLPTPTIPHHTVVCRIGGGSYGEVWLARSVLGELRAVKVISRSRFNDDRPFEREFEGIQRFEPISRSHPSQLAILHVGKNDDAGCFYYVMELADDAKVGQASSLSGVDGNSDAKTGKIAVVEFNEILLKACANDALRYHSAEEMGDELELLQRGRSVKRKRISERRLRIAKKISIATALVGWTAAALLTVVHEIPRATSNAVYHRSKNPLANKDSIRNVCHLQRA